MNPKNVFIGRGVVVMEGGGVGLETYICTQSLQNVWADAHSLQTHCSLTVFINGGEVFINGCE